MFCKLKKISYNRFIKSKGIKKMATAPQKIEQANENDLADMFGDDEPLVAAKPKVISEEVVKSSMDTLGKEAVNPKTGKTQRKSNTKLTDNDFSQLDEDVDAFMEDILSAELHSDGMNKMVDTIENLGNDTVRANSRATNRLLEMPLREAKNNGSGATNDILGKLSELRNLAIKLDPKSQNTYKNNTILGFKIPFGAGKKVDDVLQNFRNSKDQLDDIRKSLLNGRDGLQEDIATLDTERAQHYARMSELEQWSYLAAELYRRLTEKVVEIEGTDPLRAKAIKDEILFPLNQKRMDFVQDTVVAMNTYMGYQTIITNNKQLIRGVNRAINTTMGALTSSIIISQALDNQQEILNGIQALSATTSQIMEAGAVRMEIQAQEIAKSASNSTLEIEALQRTTEALVRTVEGVQNFRADSLKSMDSSIEVLRGLVAKGKEGLDVVARKRVGNLMEEVHQEMKEEASGENLTEGGKRRMKLKR